MLESHSPREVVLSLESNLHLPGVISETIRLFHDRLEPSGETIRLALRQMASDTFARWIAPLLDRNAPSSIQILEILDFLALPRANPYLLRALLVPAPAGWTDRVWSSYRTINGEGDTNQIRTDLDTLERSEATKIRALLIRRGVLPE